MAKKKTGIGKTIGATLLAVLVVGGVGVAGWATKGFTEAPELSFINKKTVEDVREDLVTFDFRSTKSGELNSASLVTFVNENSNRDEITFTKTSMHETDEETEEPYIYKVFKDGELGIRLGSSTAVGYFSLDCDEGYTFNRAKIKAVNYYKMRTDGSNTYNKQNTDSIFTINSDFQITLDVNSDDTQAYEVVTKEVEFDEPQEYLCIEALEGRPCILSLELWNE